MSTYITHPLCPQTIIFQLAGDTLCDYSSCDSEESAWDEEKPERWVKDAMAEGQTLEQCKTEFLATLTTSTREEALKAAEDGYGWPLELRYVIDLPHKDESIHVISPGLDGYGETPICYDSKEALDAEKNEWDQEGWDRDGFTGTDYTIAEIIEAAMTDRHFHPAEELLRLSSLSDEKYQALASSLKAAGLV